MISLEKRGVPWLTTHWSVSSAWPGSWSQISSSSIWNKPHDLSNIPCFTIFTLFHSNWGGSSKEMWNTMLLWNSDEIYAGPAESMWSRTRGCEGDKGKPLVGIDCDDWHVWQPLKIVPYLCLVRTITGLFHLHYPWVRSMQQFHSCFRAAIGITIHDPHVIHPSITLSSCWWL